MGGPSQSPENGSRHCKYDWIRIRSPDPDKVSQSPENGSRHCKERAVEEIPSHLPDVAIP